MQNRNNKLNFDIISKFCYNMIPAGKPDFVRGCNGFDGYLEVRIASDGFSLAI